jgi:AraC-like DNA-binding protein
MDRSGAHAYVQRLRIEDAKKRLERTDEPVDEVSWRVGYDDPAFFRRLFKLPASRHPSIGNAFGFPTSRSRMAAAVSEDAPRRGGLV